LSRSLRWPAALSRAVGHSPTNVIVLWRKPDRAERIAEVNPHLNAIVQTS
jgi:hypothetical protein